MSNALSTDQRLPVLAALLDGNSERAVEHMTEVSRKTIRRFVLRLGLGASRLHDQLVRDLRTAPTPALRRPLVIPAPPPGAAPLAAVPPPEPDRQLSLFPDDDPPVK